MITAIRITMIISTTIMITIILIAIIVITTILITITIIVLSMSRHDLAARIFGCVALPSGALTNTKNEPLEARVSTGEMLEKMPVYMIT